MILKDRDTHELCVSILFLYIYVINQDPKIYFIDPEPVAKNDDE